MSISLFSQNVPGAGSAWKAMETWRAKQKQFTDDFEAFNMNFASRLSGAVSAASDGLFEITVRRAIANAQRRADERVKQSRLDLSV